MAAKKLALALAAATATLAGGLAARRFIPHSGEVPEPVRRRLDQVDGSELQRVVLIYPPRRDGQAFIVAALTAPAVERAQLIERLAAADAALRRGIAEAGLPEDTEAFAVVTCTSDPAVRVSTQDLRSEDSGS